MLSIKPEIDYFGQIKTVLLRHCSDETVCDSVLEAIKEAIDEYHQAVAPVVDGNFREAQDSLSNTRRELNRISDLAAKLSETLDQMSPGAATQLARYMTRSVGAIKADARQFAQWTKDVKDEAQAMPDKPSDHHRVFMARSIGKALKEAGMPVSKTMPTGNITGQQGGALFGTVLQSACYAAGLGSVALKPLMKQAIDLMRDSSLP